MSEAEIIGMPVGEGEGLPNGLANGVGSDINEAGIVRERHEHKHKHRDKEQDREKDRDRHHDKERHKSSHKEKDRERHSSSHKSSHRDREKEKDRDRSKDRDKNKDRDKEKERSKDKDKERSDRHKERSDKEKSSRDKEKVDKDKFREKDKEFDKGKEKRDKDRERSDKDKHRDKERHKEREKEKHRDDKEKKHISSDKKESGSSSDRKDRDKDKHHSSHKSSHRDKEKHRENDKAKDREREKEKMKIKVEIKGQLKDFEQSFESRGAEPIVENFTDDPHIKEEPVESEEESKLVISETVAVTEESAENDEDDIPLSARKKIKVEEDDEDDDDVPLISRKKVKAEPKEKKRKKVDDDEEDFKPERKKIKKEKKEKSKKERALKEEKTDTLSSPEKSPMKRKKKEEEEENVWRWWEEEKREDGIKWTFLQHKGPVFAEAYIPLPKEVKYYYNGKEFQLSELAEEVAGFYARMLDHEYTTKEIFNKNFFKDWRKVMSASEREVIVDLRKCDFRKMHQYFVQKNEERKNRSKEEKKALKEKNEALVKEYGWCTIDGHTQRIANFKIEPPGLFRGRGEHPKQGMLKERVMPEDVIINCSKDSQIPVPPDGHKWKEVRHDNQVTWLASWTENVQGQTKYVMLNAASKLKGEKDWQKYETARCLHKIIDRIRSQYQLDWKSKEMRIRQRAVALYFIDKLALRAGNEKDEDQADTVGCCSLRVEHIFLHPEKDGKEYVVVFDFLGKDSIRYYNEVQVEKRVFKNLQLFMENKEGGDDLFDRLNTQILNKHLNELMDGLTAKVFRTYNASRTLQEQLEKMTSGDDPVPAKILSYNRANREVAVLCNHQRSVPKTFEKSMANLQKKIDDKREQVEQAEKEVKTQKKTAKQGGSVKEKVAYEKKKKILERLKEQLHKLEISATDKEENKQIALGTSKLNYLDPRISVAWCKKNGVPVEKVYNKTQRQKFQWAIDMAGPQYNFLDEPFNITRNSEGDEEEEECPEDE